MKFSLLYKQLMIANKITVKDISHCTGMSRQHVNNILKGRETPKTITTFVKLAYPLVCTHEQYCELIIVWLGNEIERTVSKEKLRERKAAWELTKCL